MTRQRSAFLLVGLTYLSFISIGLPDGLLGVAWPSIRASFTLRLDAIGPLLVMFTTGYLLSSFSSGRLLSRMTVGMLLAVSCLATAVSLLGYAMTPWWSLMVVLGSLAGLGAGAIDAGLNTYAATHFSARSVNWLHACYGVGATIGPVIMTSVLTAARPWQWGYAIVGLWQVLLAGCFVLTRRWWQSDHDPHEAPKPVPTMSTGDTLRLPVMWLSIAMFFIYTGLEAAAGTWAFSLLHEARAMPMHTAGMWVSVYWGGLTVGRLVSGVLIGIIPLHLFLRGCIIGIACGAGLIWLNVSGLISALGLVLMGLSCAAIFPSLIATTPERLGDAHTSNAVGLQIAAAVLGQSGVPGLVGILAHTFGLEIVGPSLFITALLLLLVYEAMIFLGRKTVPSHVAVSLELS